MRSQAEFHEGVFVLILCGSHKLELSHIQARELGEGITPTHVSCWPTSDTGEHELPGTSVQVLSYRPKDSRSQRASGPVC